MSLDRIFTDVSDIFDILNGCSTLFAAVSNVFDSLRPNATHNQIPVNSPS